MTFRGHFRNGVVVFDAPPALREGAVVEVAQLEPAPGSEGQSPELPSLAELLGDFIGQAQGLPSDMAENHDHYIHGTAKK